MHTYAKLESERERVDIEGKEVTAQFSLKITEEKIIFFLISDMVFNSGNY